LEEVDGKYLAGSHFATPAGIDTEDSVQKNNIDENVDSDIDSDSDGLTDELEAVYGSDPNIADSDGDGYLDGKEVENGYDPLVPGSARLGDR
jgi:hypothetical protein